MSSFKKVSINVAASFLIQISNYVFPFITIPYFTRIVGPDKYGTINFIAAFIGYFLLLINFGFDITATRDVILVKESKIKLSQVSSEVFYSKALLFTLSAIVFAILIILLPQLRNELFVCLSSFLLCLSYVLIPSFIFNGFQDNFKLAIYNIVSKVLFTIGILILIQKKQDYIVYPLILSLSHLMIGIITLFQFYYIYKLKIVRVTFSSIVARINRSKSFFYSLVIISVYTSANIIIIGFFENEETVGFFSAAIKIMAILQLCISIPFGDAMFPFFAEKFKINKEEGLRTIKSILPLVMVVSLLLCLTFCVLSPFLIGILFGEQFEKSVAMLRILSFIPVVVIYNQFIGIHIFVNLNMEGLFKRTLLYGALLGLPLNILGAYLGGGIGISITYLITEIFLASIFTFYLKKEGVSLKSLLEHANLAGFINLIHFAKSLTKKFRV